MPKAAPTPSWAAQSAHEAGPSTAPTLTKNLSSADSTSNSRKSSKTSNGSWLALGVSPSLARALNLRGFKSPTPIQRTALPSALSSPPRDVLGMARTGSGKTLAYIIPLLQRLLAKSHSISGPRALILCPTRELAVQILKVGKDLARGVTRDPQSSPLKWSIVMGGDTLESQFEALSSNPDVIIATPGRLLHLLVEMSYDLRSVEMVIYDEADRLFEMGFEVQLNEILHRLPPNRQNLLFSATLPTAVAEFAKAGLTNPLLHRLDADQKISEDLQLSFFSTKANEKDAALLAILETVLQIPLAEDAQPSATSTKQAIIFVATKHHVEYLTPLLATAGYRANHIYGSLDQIARQQQLTGFRNGLADLLVVTDVAARGLDIPVMDNVINYDFPSGVKTFVHRVGRTARAGRKGTAWTFVTRDDLPYMLDLQAFLGRDYLAPEARTYWTIPQETMDDRLEAIGRLAELSQDLPTLRSVMERGQAMYERSRPKASSRSYQNAKERKPLDASIPVHPSFPAGSSSSSSDQQAQLLAKLSAFTPNETILELGSRGRTGNADLMAARRNLIAKRAPRPQADLSVPATETQYVVTNPKETAFRDDTHYISHSRTGAIDDQGYSIANPNFIEQLGKATFDISQDEGSTLRANRPSQLKWDKKKKRMIKDEVGADNKKLIRSESGALLPASYKSGRFDDWRKSRKPGGAASTAQHGGNRYRGRHTAGSASEHRNRASVVPAGGKKVNELRTAAQIASGRRLAEKRKAKNSRPSRKR